MTSWSPLVFPFFQQRKKKELSPKIKTLIWENKKEILSLQDLMKRKSSQKQCFSTFASHSWLWILPTPTIQLNPQPKYPQIPPKFCFFFFVSKTEDKNTKRKREKEEPNPSLSSLTTASCKYKTNKQNGARQHRSYEPTFSKLGARSSFRFF